MSGRHWAGLAACGVAAAVALGAGSGGDAEFAKIREEAEKLHREGSYALARGLYVKAGDLAVSPSDRRWTAFRLADTQWRAQAGSQTSDSTPYDQARQQLEALVRDVQKVEDRDRVWAEVQESLGDFWWTRRDNRNWWQAWQHYQQALDWWAGARDTKTARARYIRIVRVCAQPPVADESYYYGYYGNQIPVQVVRNALKLAQTGEDESMLHFLLAMALQQSGQWEERRFVADEFDAVLKAGKKSEWYDDALFRLGEWLANNGRMIREKNGGWRQERDYLAALDLFRRILSEFRKGETRYHDQARDQIAAITRPDLSVAVGSVFLPGSEVQFNVHWRNMAEVSLALYRVDLTKAIRFAPDRSPYDWIAALDPGAGSKVREWSHATGDKGDHQPGNATLRLDGKPAMGAYLLTASGGGKDARELVLVTDAALVTKAAGARAVAYLCNALDGSPLAEATVRLWTRYHDGNNYQWKEMASEADADGLAAFDMPAGRYHEFFVCAAIGDRQAFCQGNTHWRGGPEAQWRIHAFTDRPAYRPKEKVQWKLIARVLDGGAYSTPGNQVLDYEIRDPRGAKLRDGKLTLNAFGSGWGECELGEQLPLGEYRVVFWTDNRSRHIGESVLFRMEEYKLPEFKVAVRTPGEKGRRKTFLAGDKVEATVQADYYFGGAVANASVEVLVRQNPFHPSWTEKREFPWFYDDMTPHRDYGGEGQIIKRETLKTDAAGRAAVTFDTPRQPGQSWEYRIEARVVDASRREVVGSGTVRVANQRYFAHLKADHNLYQPRDTVTARIRTVDANDEPFAAEGTVTVTRQSWVEVWTRPDGQDVKGAALKALRSAGAFPPPPRDSREKPWQLKFNGYESEAVATRTVKSGADGEAQFSFEPGREGYYQIAWSDPEDDGRPVNGATAVWVASDATADMGYRHGGLQIIVDKDTVLPGKKTPVMICVPGGERHVLLCLEGEELFSHQLVRLTGNVKWVEVPIEDRHVPNIYLSALMVSDRQAFMDSKQLIVPPVKHFLNLTVKPDKAQYEPRAEGTLEITATDHEGKPVAAEVALGLVDESVFYIQKDYAGDPRQFYFGQKRGQYTQTQSTFSQRQYVRLVEGPQKALMDDRYVEQLRKAERTAAAGSVPGNEASRREALSEVGAEFSPVVHGARARSAMAFKSDSGIVAETKEEMEDSLKDADERRGDKFKRGQKKNGKPGSGGEGDAEPAVTVRTDFRATAFWQPDVVTDKDGKARVRVQYPDSLTGWRATARAAGTGAQFGMASADTRTRMPLIVRLQAPRFFVVGDSLTLSAVINNNTDKAVTVKPGLAAEGLAVTGIVKDGRAAKGEHGSLIVPPNGDARADWVVFVEKAGPVRLRVAARGDGLADAMENTFVAHEHGIEKFVARSGKARGDDVTVRLDIPRERMPESTLVTVQVTPSIAVTLLDALPYLAQYPYGCTEQTMSRFLPAVITAKTLKDMGLKAEAVAGRLFGGVEPEHADKTHSKPAGDLAKLDGMVQAGLDRLYGFQHADGGWGWWKDGDSDHFMSAYVVWGLTLARGAGVPVQDNVLTRAVEFLDKEIVEEEANPDLQAWMLHALAVAHAARQARAVAPFQAKAMENLWERKDGLNAYTRALLALAAHHYGQAEKAQALVRNLLNGVKRDAAPDVSVVVRGGQESAAGVMGTAHWGEDGLYWRWSDGGVEATAFALRALLAVDPKSELVEPVMNWLVKNRRGAQWSNTRDTAIAVLAMNDYLRVSGELQPDMEIDIQVNGRPLAGAKMNAQTVFTAPSRFAVDRALLRDGTNEFRIVRKGGQGALYYAIHAGFFSLEEPVKPAGNEIFVRRQYYRHAMRSTLLKGVVYDREPLGDGGTVASGDRVETVITVEAKNNYEYLVFEDLKPAGLEAVQVRSGGPVYARELKSGALARRLAAKASDEAVSAEAVEDPADYTGRTRWVHQELRDRKVALFLDKLPEGVWEIRYDLRAEVPGRFHALPVLGHAMYVPEIRCNGEEVRVTVEERSSD